MVLENIVIVGAAGHAKAVIDVVERAGRCRIAGLVDSFKPPGESWFGYKLLGSEGDLPALVQSLDLGACLVAIGDNWRRHQAVERIRALAPQLEFITAVHPSAQLARGVSLGRGTVVMAGAVVNSDSRVGSFCILNTNCSLDHDGIMEDYASLAPGAVTGGNVRIGAFSAVSLGARVLQGRSIGEHTLIGAGALVLEDIPAYRVAYGTPAAVVRERSPGDKYL
jgi:sugar O-acyltransferase (sialic acid O-acetyltransferase NeuD family)